MRKKPEYMTTGFERFSYFGFFLGQNIIYVIQLQYLSYFLTEEVGISLATVALMLGISRVWDAVNDPIMGALIDKARFKSGKFLPWIRISTFLIPFFLLAMFVNPASIFGANTPMTLKIIFSLAAILMWDFSYTLSDAPIFSLATVMTDRLYERDKLMSAGRTASAVAAISSAVYAAIKTEVGTTATVAIYCIVALLFMLPVSFAAKERVNHPSNDIGFVEIFKYLFKNKPLLVFYVGYLAVAATNTLQPLAIYFARFNLGDEGLTTMIMAVVIVPVIIVAPLLPKLIGVFGKKKLTIFSSIAAIILCVVQYFTGYQNLYLFLAVAVVRVVFMQIPLLMYGMFTADCIEWCANKTGKRTEGISFSLQTLMTKFGGSLVTIIALAIMGAFGYVEQAQTQSASALEGIWLCMTLLPAVGYLVMLVIMAFFYKLDESEVEKMIEANQAKEIAENGTIQ